MERNPWSFISNEAYPRSPKVEGVCGQDFKGRRNLRNSSETQFFEAVPSLLFLECCNGIGGGGEEVVDAKVDNQNTSMETQDHVEDCDNPKREQYPVPLTPLSGEVAKRIEYERAMVAELAMNSGPALTRSGVLFEDEWLLVINKPCGIYSEHVLATAPSLLTSTLPHPPQNGGGQGLHLHMANRLDRDTSGVMVITKCKNAAAKLSHIFTKRQVQKSYVALCRRGATAQRPSWTELIVDSGHGRSRFGAWRVYSKNDVGRKLPGGSVVRDMTTQLLIVSVNRQETTQFEQIALGCAFQEEEENEKEESHNITYLSTPLGAEAQQPSNTLQVGSNDMVGEVWPLLEEFSNDGQIGNGSNELIVIRAFPLTGRTHQIRLHCQLVGLPLIGDVKYGGPLHSPTGEKYSYHALHAESLYFKHPFTFEDLNFLAPLPQWAVDARVLPLVR